MEKWLVFVRHENQENYCLCVLLNWNINKEGWEAFELILVLQGGLASVILEYFVNFLDDPYYEPLPWFMIFTG